MLQNETLTGTIYIASGPEPVLEDITVKSGSVQQTVVADEGYDGIGEVTVEPIALQNKTVTPSASQQTVTADTGYDGLGTVTVEASATGDIDFVMNPDSYGVAENSFAHQEHLKSFTCNNRNSSNQSFRVDNNAFNSCSALTTVRIERCNTFNGMTFSNCNNITDYYFGGSFNGTVPNYNMMTPADFSGTPNYKIHVPASLESAWKSDLGWGEYADHIVGDYTE